MTWDRGTAGDSEVKATNEFCKLTQGICSMLDHDNNFNYQSQYTSLDIPTELMKCLNFKNGLSLL